MPLKNTFKERTLSSEESFLLDNIQQFAQRLKSQYNYSYSQISDLIQNDEILIPAEIFSFNLAPSESLTKYLKENCAKTFHEISVLTNRNERSLWQNYRRAVNKRKTKFSDDSKEKIPLSAFENNRLSIFESLIYFLKEEKGLKNIKIAKILKKHPANIWSVYDRAVKKLK